MACRMRECLCQIRLTQHTAGCLVHLSTAYAWSHCLYCGFLRFQHRLVCIPFACFWLTKEYCAGHIRAITFENNTEVEGQESSPGQAGQGGAAVRQRRPHPRSDDCLKRHGDRKSTRLNSSHL